MTYTAVIEKVHTKTFTTNENPIRIQPRKGNELCSKQKYHNAKE